MRRTFTVISMVLFMTLILPPASSATPLGAQFVPVTDMPSFCGAEVATVTINLNNVANLYGYQFEVAYDPNLVSANGMFVNTFFDTSMEGAADEAK